MALAQKAFAPSTSRLGPVRVSRTVSLSVFARESRIGSKPITIPKGVTITVDGTTLKVKVCRQPHPGLSRRKLLLSILPNAGAQG